MNRLSYLAAVLAAVALLTLPVRAQSVDFSVGDRNITQARLSNGLRVIVVANHSAPVVQTSVWYGFGSLDETPGRTGLAHALEHMMFRGTADISAGGLTDIAAHLGAQMNAQTDYDYTQFYFIMPSDKLQLALQIEADRMQRLALRQSDWEIERRAVLNELDSDDSSPFYNLLARVRAAAYPDVAAGRTPAGRRADVAAASAADIAAYYHRWYVPQNATLVIAGDVAPAGALAAARRTFATIPSHAVPQHAAQHPKAASGKIVEAEFPFPFEVLDLAYAVPGDTEPGEPAISTLSALIQNQRGPFYHDLVETNVALAIETNPDTQLRGGLLHVFVVLNPGHSADAAQNIFQRTMDRLVQDGIAPDLARAAQRQTLAERAYSADSISGYGDLVGYTYGIVGERVADEDRRIASLTPAALIAAARTYLRVPNVVGHLRPNDRPARGNSQKSTATVSDDFSGRAPNGPIVEPASMQAQLRAPATARSKLSPVSFTLANGMRVLVQEKHDRPTAYIAGAIAASPSTVPDGREGLPRLASTLANFGSAKYDFDALRKQTDDIGAAIDLGQSFSAHGFARDLEKLLDMLADGEEHPQFPDRWLQLQREQLANSLGEENQISGVMVQRAYQHALLPPNDPALRYATPQSVNGISREDLLAYAARAWRPDLTTLTIVGDVSVDRARRAVQNAFGGWNASGPPPQTAQAALPPAHVAHAAVFTSANQVFVLLGQPAVSRTSPDYDAFAILNQLLGGSGFFESRLWQELRQKRGLVYSVQSELKSDRDRGDLQINFNAGPDHIRSAVNIVRSEMRRLQNAPPSESELSEAKIRLVSSALMDEASAQSELDEILGSAVEHAPLGAAAADAIQRVSAADVQRVARLYLHPDALIQVYAGPQGPWSEGPL